VVQNSVVQKYNDECLRSFKLNLFTQNYVSDLKKEIMMMKWKGAPEN